MKQKNNATAFHQIAKALTTAQMLDLDMYNVDMDTYNHLYHYNYELISNFYPGFESVILDDALVSLCTIEIIRSCNNQPLNVKLNHFMCSYYGFLDTKSAKKK